MISNIDKEKLIAALEDEYEVYLKPQDKPSFELIRSLQKKYNLSPKEAKKMACNGGVMEEKFSALESLAYCDELTSVGGECVRRHTGINYLAQYNAKEIEDFLSNNSRNNSIGDYYTTEVGCVLYEMENTTYGCLIESDNFYRSCIRYLIEKGQVKLNKQLQL